MVAKLLMIGRLGSDPKVISGSSGKDFVTFSLATSRYMGKDKDPVTEWYDFKAFQVNAEKAAKYAKGSQLYVEATPTIEKWDDKASGKEVKRIVFLVDKVLPMSNGASGSGSTGVSAPAKPAGDEEIELEDPFAEDGPFSG